MSLVDFFVVVAAVVVFSFVYRFGTFVDVWLLKDLGSFIIQLKDPNPLIQVCRFVPNTFSETIRHRWYLTI